MRLIRDKCIAYNARIKDIAARAGRQRGLADAAAA